MLLSWYGAVTIAEDLLQWIADKLTRETVTFLISGSFAWAIIILSGPTTTAPKESTSVLFISSDKRDLFDNSLLEVLVEDILTSGLREDSARDAGIISKLNFQFEFVKVFVL